MSFRNRGPKVLNGINKLLGTSFRAAPGQLPGAPAGHQPNQPMDPVQQALFNQAQRDAREAAVLVLDRLRVAELQVRNVNKALQAFEAQASRYPEDNPLRVAVLQMCSTLREAIAAAETGHTVAEAAPAVNEG